MKLTEAPVILTSTDGASGEYYVYISTFDDDDVSEKRGGEGGEGGEREMSEEISFIYM
jgi:hypothetical protein